VYSRTLFNNAPQSVPTHELHVRNCCDDKRVEIGPLLLIPLKMAVWSRSSSGELWWPLNFENRSAFVFVFNPNSHSNRHQRAIDWLTTIQLSVHPSSHEEQLECVVQVGILDNGVGLTHPGPHQTPINNPISYAPTVPEAIKRLRHLHSHGTHAASVLMEVSPIASLFVARVVDEEGKSCGENDYVATAEVTFFRNSIKILGYGTASSGSS